MLAKCEKRLQVETALLFDARVYQGVTKNDCINVYRVYHWNNDLTEELGQGAVDDKVSCMRATANRFPSQTLGLVPLVDRPKLIFILDLELQ